MDCLKTFPLIPLSLLSFFMSKLEHRLSTLSAFSSCCRSANPGTVHHCFIFSPFVDNGSYYGSLESQNFTVEIVFLSLLDSYLISSLRSEPYVFLFSILVC